MNATEEGNILLTTSEYEAHIAWIRLEGDTRLQVHYDIDNRPMLIIKTVVISDTELTARILKDHAGWRIEAGDLPFVLEEGRRFVSYS